jgi:hypothetical protein
MEKSRRDELAREKDALQAQVAELGGMVKSQERLLELEKVCGTAWLPGRSIRRALVEQIMWQSSCRKTHLYTCVHGCADEIGGVNSARGVKLAAPCNCLVAALARQLLDCSVVLRCT